MISEIASNRWLIATARSSLVLGVSEGRPVQLYWGARLSPEDASALPDPDSVDATALFDGWGGHLAAEPAVKARFPGGGRSAVLAFTGADVARWPDHDDLVLTLTEGAGGLRVRVHARVWADSDVVERWAVLESVGDEPVWLDRAFSGCWPIPRLRDYRMSALHGRWAGEAQLERTRLPHGAYVAETRLGITWHHTNPWLAIDDGSATEDDGRVWAVALAWSGNWKLVAERADVRLRPGVDDNRGFVRRFADVVRISGGFNDFDFAWRLTPGETLALPTFAGVYSDHGFGGASRSWHDHANAHVLSSKTLRPVLYNSWEAVHADVSEDNQMRLAETAARIGCELFVMDAGWFNDSSDNFSSNLGSWTPSPRKFPRGLRPLAERVRELGMEFGLWVEPEMAAADAELFTAHPEWLIGFDGAAIPRSGRAVLNYARADVRDHIVGVLNRLVRDNGLAFLKWDCNRYVSEPGWTGYEGPDPQRIWAEHVRGGYEVMDRVRAANPGLAIETCAGGGGRVDFGILARTEQFWASDNTDAVDRISIQDGFSQVYPARAMVCWVTDSPNEQTHRALPLAYRCHVAMMGALGIGMDLAGADDGELAELTVWIAHYKRLRPVIQAGRRRRLSTPPDVFAVSYVSTDRERAVVIAARTMGRHGDPAVTVPLRGLDDARAYRVARLNDGRGAAEISGSALRERGVELDLPMERDSAVIELTAR
jgi:alpha-galactosidase